MPRIDGHDIPPGYAALHRDIAFLNDGTAVTIGLCDCSLSLLMPQQVTLVTYLLRLD